MNHYCFITNLVSINIMLTKNDKYGYPKEKAYNAYTQRHKDGSWANMRRPRAIISMGRYFGWELEND